MGNPDAPVKLVEYGSLTCPHCAEFARRARRPRCATAMSAPAGSAVEYRTFMLNGPTDRRHRSCCSAAAAPARLFPRSTEQLYATQPHWMGRVQALPRGRSAASSQALPPRSRRSAGPTLRASTRSSAQRGLTPARISACLADGAALDRLAEMHRARRQRAGRPGHADLLDQRPAGRHASDWAGLEPLLARALSERRGPERATCR